MIFKFEGKQPKIDEKAYAFTTSTVIGMVEMKEYSSVWPNVTVRGDVNRIEIGRYTNIQDNAVLHVADKYACVVGDFVTVGHSALLHACTVEDHCLIGMHATVLDGAVVGRGSNQAVGNGIAHDRRIIKEMAGAGIHLRQIHCRQFDIFFLGFFRNTFYSCLCDLRCFRSNGLRFFRKRCNRCFRNGRRHCRCSC
ncbi:MAG: gamma carbonic anhydrase family protein, partial [Phascolarctobacterium sp.]|nr:gamma carbonic anhydrase family protein [Phascolarctobacterium sp.]